MKKIIIISDTHGFVHQDIIALVAKSDIVIHAGDVGTQEVLNNLQKMKDVIVVAGNNDDHIANLKDNANLELFGCNIAIEHGHKHGHHQPCHNSLRKTHNNADIVIYGHTHIQVIDKSAKPWVVNPGAAGMTRTNGGASCLLLEVYTNKKWHIKEMRFQD